MTPDEGYVLDTLTVTAANGDKINLNRGSNGRYTFEMPASRVTVEATFVEEGGEEAAEPFVDVSAGDWFYDAVVYVYDNGLMSGTAATTFGPNVGTTRGMIATILWRLAGSPNGGANPFTDVSSSDYYAEAVAWAAGEGIVGGYGNGVFGANDPITREQMALMMYRYAQYAGYETSQRSAQLSSYADYAGCHHPDAVRRERTEVTQSREMTPIEESRLKRTAGFSCGAFSFFMVRHRRNLALFTMDISLLTLEQLPHQTGSSDTAHRKRENISSDAA